MGVMSVGWLAEGIAAGTTPEIAGQLVDLLVPGVSAALGALAGAGAASVPGYASGTLAAAGGLALVGERGPELVNVPRGSRVYSNEETRQMGGNTYSIVQNFYGRTDAKDAEIGVRRAMRASGVGV